MSNALFAWTNRVTTGSLSTSSAVAGMDAGQLQNDQGATSTAWQTTSATAQWLVIDAGGAVPWRLGGMFRTNFTTGATSRWRISNDPTFATSIYDTGVGPAGVVAGYGQSVWIALSDQVGRYCRVDISDSTNPNGSLNIPLVFAGPAWLPLSNIDYSTTFGRDDQTDEVVSRGGQEFPGVQFVRRRWDVSLSGIRPSELWPQAMELDRFARSGSNVLFVPDPVGAVAQEAIFGRAKSLADVAYPYTSPVRRSWKVRFSERL